MRNKSGLESFVGRVIGTVAMESGAAFCDDDLALDGVGAPEVDSVATELVVMRRNGTGRGCRAGVKMEDEREDDGSSRIPCQREVGVVKERVFTNGGVKSSRRDMVIRFIKTNRIT